MKIKLGTRKSSLALAQAQMVASQINAYFPECKIEIHKFITTGDTLYDANLALVGGKGLFVKEIEDALISGQIDIAVHSMKDVPAVLPEGLHISCVLERGEIHDVLISHKYNKLDDLPQGAVIGTSSSRRKLQILKLRPDLKIVPFRGNVNTRIDKLKSESVDAIILAHAGLSRLGLGGHIKHIFSEDEMLPAIAQGAIGIESRIDDKKVNDILQAINHKTTFNCITIERAFMIEVAGDCTTPIAGLCKIDLKGKASTKVGYAPDDTHEIVYDTITAGIESAELEVRKVAKRLKMAFASN